MTKYNEEVLNSAEDSVAMVVSASMPTETVGAIATAVFDSLTRAPWWEEVGSDYRFGIGEPWRREVFRSSATEGTVIRDGQIGNKIALPDTTYFRDTRWTPPPAPLAVGDVIETIEDLERLPEGAGVVDGCGDLAQKTVSGGFQFADHNPMSHPPETIIHCRPFTVVHLPKTEATK